MNALLQQAAAEIFVLNRTSKIAIYVFLRFVILALSIGLIGCRQLAPTPPSPTVKHHVAQVRRTFTDGLGREIMIPYPPQRIISLAPNLTEMLFELGLDDRIIGVTIYCDYPIAALAKEKVGDTLRPNTERIIGLKPDLVLISTASQLENFTRRLDELAIPVYTTDPRTVREVATSLRHLGEVTDAEARAMALAAEMERRIEAIEAAVRHLPRPRVLYVLQMEPLITAGRNSFINDLIRLAGGESISATEPTDYPQFSRETVIARAPEVIIVPESHGSELVSLAGLRREFAATPAVKRNQIVRLDPDLLNRPGPRIVDGLELLAHALHPEQRF